MDEICELECEFVEMGTAFKRFDILGYSLWAKRDSEVESAFVALIALEAVLEGLPCIWVRNHELNSL
jgi:hypothetical protein